MPDLGEAIKEAFQREPRIVKGLLDETWPEEHGVDTLIGVTDAVLHAATGVWNKRSMEEMRAAVRAALRQRKVS